MLEAKTRGNLDPREEGLLKQSLTSLRLAFVEAVSHPAAPAQGGEPKVATEKGSPRPRPPPNRPAPRRKPEADSPPNTGGGRIAQEVYQEVLVNWTLSFEPAKARC